MGQLFTSENNVHIHIHNYINGYLRPFLSLISVVYENGACVPLDNNVVAVLKIENARGNASEN